MLAISGGLEVAMAIAEYSFYINMPRVLRIELIGNLPDWVCAKDIILEILRCHRVKGGVGFIIERGGSRTRLERTGG